MQQKIVVIDLRKFNSEVCVLDTGTGEIRIQRIVSDRAYLERVHVIELVREPFNSGVAVA